MSLDVYIKYKVPKVENYGKTHRIHLGYSEVGNHYTDVSDCKEWSANITHNCSVIAEHVPISDSKTLYDYVWSDKKENTNHMRGILETGITYMITHKEELEQYNPENGWGSYEGFLCWLMDYWIACINNPGCEIIVSK